MIIGSGLIASSLKKIDTPNQLFFAAGVSNSLETKASEFEREFSLLKDTIEKNDDIPFIYFSTLSINDQTKQNSPYVLHKQNMERHIQEHCSKHLILRIGNIVGRGGNPNTLINFLKDQIENEKQIQVHRKAKRFLVDIDDIAIFLQSVPHLQNTIINFSYPQQYAISDILNSVEGVLSKKAVYSVIEDGDFYEVPFDKEVLHYFSTQSPQIYLQKILEKHIL